MSVANSYDKNCIVVVDPIDDNMRFEGMNSDWRTDFMPLANDTRIICYQIQ